MQKSPTSCEIGLLFVDKSQANADRDRVGLMSAVDR
jgi:hypothetical protein